MFINIYTSPPRSCSTSPPPASLPVAIAWRNRIVRKMVIEAIESDSLWKGGEYTTVPEAGMCGAYSSLFWMTSSPLQLWKRSPTRRSR